MSSEITRLPEPAAVPTSSRLLTVHEVATYLAVPVATLYQWRYLHTGPAAYRVGRHIRYDPNTVQAWLRQQTA